MTEAMDLKRFFREMTEKGSSHITAWNIRIFWQTSPKVTKTHNVLTRFAAKHGRMINHHPAFLHQLFHIPIAQSIAQIPVHPAEDDVRLKMTPFEEGTIVHSRPPVIWDRDDAARCSRSPAILATEPGIAGRTQQKVDSMALGIDRPIEIIPLLLDFDVGLIDPVRIIRRCEIWPAAFVELRRIALDPAEHRRMVV